MVFPPADGPCSGGGLFPAVAMVGWPWLGIDDEDPVADRVVRDGEL